VIADKQETLWDLTRGQRLRYASSILAMWVSTIFLFGVPFVSGDALDGIVEGRALDRLWGAAAAIVGLTALSAVFQYLRGRWAAIAAEGIVRGLRDRLYEHLGRLPCAYHDKADTGDLVQRCTSDVETVRVFLSSQVVEIGRTVLLVATALPIMFWLDVRLTLVAIALFLPILCFAVYFFRRVRALFLRMDEAEGRMTTVLQENLTGIRVVRAFARQEYERAKFAGKNDEFRDRNYKLIELMGVYWSVSDVLCLSQVGLVLFAGTWWMVQGDLTVGTLWMFLVYENAIIWPVRHLGRVLADTGKAMVALGRLREILSEVDESAAGEAPAALLGGIAVEGLTFAFGDRAPVLRNLNLRIDAGETVAILGPPGAGKSVIVQLWLRLYDYEHGSIRLDGCELRDLERRFVRSQIGVVLQEPFLFSKTIGANVRLGHAAASDEEMVDSASAACIHQAIEGFDQGYETLVGERGVMLSGGQRQRVALARAILKDPAILVLDDALSAVDTHTEAHILKALHDRRGRRTTIIIAHRLSSVLAADRILVIENGVVVQDGSHRELSGQEGPYARLWRIQGAQDAGSGAARRS